MSVSTKKKPSGPPAIVRWMLIVVIWITLLAFSVPSMLSEYAALQRRENVVILVDITRSMSPGSAQEGAASRSVDDGWAIARQLLSRLRWGRDRAALFIVNPLFQESHNRVQLRSTSDGAFEPAESLEEVEKRLPEAYRTGGGEFKPGSNYHEAADAAARYFSTETADGSTFRHLYVVGDLVHQIGEELTAQLSNPNPPAESDLRAFSGVDLHLVRPTSSEHGAFDPIGWWRLYFADRGNTQIAVDSFTAALGASLGTAPPSPVWLAVRVGIVALIFLAVPFVVNRLGRRSGKE